MAEAAAIAAATDRAVLPVKLERVSGRLLYFEDVEVRRSRAKGIACRVTLKKGEETFVGEAEGMENERSRIELAARAALAGAGAGGAERPRVGAGWRASDRGVRSRVRVRRRDGAVRAHERVADGELRDP